MLYRKCTVKCIYCGSDMEWAMNIHYRAFKRCSSKCMDVFITHKEARVQKALGLQSEKIIDYPL